MGVQMENLKDGKAVMKKLQMSSLKGQKMWIQQCRGVNNERNEDSKGMDKEVIVRNLPLDIQEKTLRKLCAEHGNVERVHIAKDKNGYPQRLAFVQMSTVEEADAVFDALHESKVGGCSMMTAFKNQSIQQKRTQKRNDLRSGWRSVRNMKDQDAAKR